MTFEHRNENKSCSACRERVTEWVRKWVNEWERECSWFPAFAWRSDIYISCDLYATFLYYIAVNPIWRCHIYWVQTCFGRFLLLQLQPFQLTADLVDTKELVKSFGHICYFNFNPIQPGLSDHGSFSWLFLTFQYLSLIRNISIFSDFYHHGLRWQWHWQCDYDYIPV